MDPSELAAIGLFADLSPEDLAAIAAEARLERHPTGYVLAEQDDIPTKFFVLISGSVTVDRDGSHVVDLGPGDFFGEVGVLSLENRNASVIATTPIEVAVMMGWSLRELMDRQPELAGRLQTAAAARSTG
ncbi:MAG: cyclic nucleotide-binding domain-containing protein [Acidimicrobiia bacterium]